MRFLLLITAFLSMNIFAAGNTAIAKSTESCLFEGVVPNNIECGVLTTPADHFSKSEREIRLPYLIIKPTKPTPDLPPLIYLSGGPGVSTGIHNRLFVVYWRVFANRVAPNRRLVIVELRGSRNSIPTLDCPETHSATYALNVEWSQIGDEIIVREKPKIPPGEACLARLKKEGKNLSSASRIQIAHDVKALADHLKATQISLIGQSYGTTYAMTVASEFPMLVDGMILDSVFPPEATSDVKETLHLSETLDEIFSECKQQPICAEKYPDLKTRFFELLKELDEIPWLVNFNTKDPPSSHVARLDAHTFVNLIRSLIGWPWFLEQFPELVVNRNSQVIDYWVQAYADYGAFDHYSFGASMSGNCSDLPTDYNPDSDSPTNSMLEKLELENWNFKACKNWTLQRADEVYRRPLVSDIPTLLFSSRFDPATPPHQARMAKKGLSNSYLFEFPSGVHSITGSDQCAQQIAKTFLINPSADPTVDCFRNYRKFRFQTEF